MRCRSAAQGPTVSPVYHSVVWAHSWTYGAVYFYNVIIPPPATTPLKLSACWGKNSVRRPADPDTAEHKQWGEGLRNTHGHFAARTHTQRNGFSSYKQVILMLCDCVPYVPVSHESVQAYGSWLVAYMSLLSVHRPDVLCGIPS